MYVYGYIMVNMYGIYINIIIYICIYIYIFVHIHYKPHIVFSRASMGIVGAKNTLKRQTFFPSFFTNVSRKRLEIQVRVAIFRILMGQRFTRFHQAAVEAAGFQVVYHKDDSIFGRRWAAPMDWSDWTKKTHQNWVPVATGPECLVKATQNVVHVHGCVMMCECLTCFWVACVNMKNSYVSGGGKPPMDQLQMQFPT